MFDDHLGRLGRQLSRVTESVIIPHRAGIRWLKTCGIYTVRDAVGTDVFAA